MHFEIASACIKESFIVGAFANSVHLSLLGGSTEFRVFLFCFDKLLFLTFLQLYKKEMGHGAKEPRLILT